MKGRIISPGECKGTAIVSKEPIGFYGGVDLKTGIIIEKNHSLEGKSIKNKVKPLYLKDKILEKK